MKKLAPHYVNEQTGISYILSANENYYLPNFALSKQEKFVIGKYGRMRLRYLKEHRKIIYVDLLTSGTLNSHLHDIDETAFSHMELLSQQMAQREGITEQLKSENQMLWVQRINNIHNRVDEIIREKLIYC